MGAITRSPHRTASSTGMHKQNQAHRKVQANSNDNGKNTMRACSIRNQATKLSPSIKVCPQKKTATTGSRCRPAPQIHPHDLNLDIDRPYIPGRSGRRGGTELLFTSAPRRAAVLSPLPHQLAKSPLQQPEQEFHKQSAAKLSLYSHSEHLPRNWKWD